AHQDTIHGEGLGEPSPLGVDETHNWLNRHVSTEECSLDRVHLSGHSGNQFRAVAAADVETKIRSEPAAYVASFDLSLVALGIYDMHARGRHDDVVDVRLRSGDATVMNRDDSVV